MIKTEGLLKSQMEIVDDHLNKAVSANYNDFLTGIRLIQEIDLDLSRSNVYVQNTRRMLEQSKKTITEPGLSIAQERRRELAFTMRWYDIKRLNANEDTSDDITIVKTFYPYNTSTVLSSEAPIEYRIEPGSRKFATPIPDVEITRSEGVIQQNTY